MLQLHARELFVDNDSDGLDGPEVGAAGGVLLTVCDTVGRALARCTIHSSHRNGSGSGVLPQYTEDVTLVEMGKNGPKYQQTLGEALVTRYIIRYV